MTKRTESPSSASQTAAPAAIRPATVRDAARMLEIINGYAATQEMLPRSPLWIFENLRDFVIADRAGEVVGCGALHVVWGDLAEVRSIAVAPCERGKGTGRRLAEALLEQADALLLPRVFAFTYVPGFFEKLGFRVVEHAELPHKVFADCLNCPKFNCCDEIAMLQELRPIDGTFPTAGPLSRPLPNLAEGPHRVSRTPKHREDNGQEV